MCSCVSFTVRYILMVEWSGRRGLGCHLKYGLFWPWSLPLRLYRIFEQSLSSTQHRLLLCLISTINRKFSTKWTNVITFEMCGYWCLALPLNKMTSLTWVPFEPRIRVFIFNRGIMNVNAKQGSSIDIDQSPPWLSLRFSSALTVSKSWAFFLVSS